MCAAVQRAYINRLNRNIKVFIFYYETELRKILTDYDYKYLIDNKIFNRLLYAYISNIAAKDVY